MRSIKVVALPKRLVLTTVALVVLAACSDARVGTEIPSAVGQNVAGTVIEIKFREPLMVRTDFQQKLRSERGADLTSLQQVLDRLRATEVRPLLSTQAISGLALLSADAQRISGDKGPDMLAWHRVTLPLDADIAVALGELRARPEVEHAYVAPRPVAPPVAPDFTPNQENYFGAAPSGTEQLFARALAGGRGVGVMVVDLEYDWTFEHEDLGLTPAILIVGQRSSQFCDDPPRCLDHGTAVLGVLAGRDNGFGIIGGVPDATIRVASPWIVGYYLPANAITSASGQMSVGDVLLLEQQADGPGAGVDLVPVEWILSVYDAIRLASLAGRVVVEAAGNGGFNLDAAIYNGRFNRNFYNSYAVMVGAGDAANARLSFSNYGSRLDVQAHGQSVTTTGFGGLFGSTNTDEYTSGFNGTSSASAIVTAAAASVQGYLKNQLRPARTGPGMSLLFQSTGSPQTGNVAERIGPKPNLVAAIPQLAAPLINPTVAFVRCTGFAGLAELKVTTKTDASNLTVQKSPANQNVWSPAGAWQHDAVGTVHTITVGTPGAMQLRAKSTDSTLSPPETPWVTSSQFNC